MLTLSFVAIFVLAVVAHFAGCPKDVAAGRAVRALDSRVVVGLVFVVTVALLRYSWATWHPLPLVHDEMAYLLQAQIFARGRWTMPAPPMPAFWEQPQILTQPLLAAKYFPGHALLLALGVLVGWPPLVPLVLQGIAGALIFVLVRRVAGGVMGLFTWFIWLSTPMVLHFGPSYYSEATTIVCWLAGWYALLEWREKRQARWLVGVAVCVGWCFLTRPLTGVAYAIPVAIVVLRDVVRLRRWRDLVLATVAGAGVLAIIPLWSARTTGDWRRTPLLAYTHTYMPYDVPGFGLITTPPAVEVSPQLARLNWAYARWHVHHLPAELPRILVERVPELAATLWGTTRGLMIVFAVLGLVTLESATAFAVGSSVLLLLVYLLFATPSQWTLYYYESAPAYAFLTAAGLAWSASLIGRPRGIPAGGSYDWRSPRWAMPLAAAALVLAGPTRVSLRVVRAAHIKNEAVQLRFLATRDHIPDARAVLFVRYHPQHDANVSFVRNVIDPDAERVWVVFDRGTAENARLLARAPGRVAYVWEEERDMTFRYDVADRAMAAR